MNIGSVSKPEKKEWAPETLEDAIDLLTAVVTCVGGSIMINRNDEPSYGDQYFLLVTCLLLGSRDEIIEVFEEKIPEEGNWLRKNLRAPNTGEEYIGLYGLFVPKAGFDGFERYRKIVHDSCDKMECPYRDADDVTDGSVCTDIGDGIEFNDNMAVQGK